MVGEIADEVIAAGGHNSDLGQAEVDRRLFKFTSVGIGRSWHQCDLHHPPLGRGHAVDHRRVDHGVNQDRRRQFFDLCRVQRTVDMVDASDATGPETGHPDKRGVGDHRRSSRVVRGGDVDSHGHCLEPNRAACRAVGIPALSSPPRRRMVSCWFHAAPVADESLDPTGWPWDRAMWFPA